MIVQKKPLPEAIKAAMLNAESVIAHYGAKNILLSKKKLEERVKNDKRAVKAKKEKKTAKKRR
jgi:hypothetical protein